MNTVAAEKEHQIQPLKNISNIYKYSVQLRVPLIKCLALLITVFHLLSDGHMEPLQVTVQNPENQGYLIAYKDSQLIVSAAR